MTGEREWESQIFLPLASIDSGLKGTDFQRDNGPVLAEQHDELVEHHGEWAVTRAI